MGVLEGCDRFLKYLFFIFTFVFWLLGICAIGIGIWAAVDQNFTKILDLNIPGLDAHALKKAAILLIIVGVGVMIVGFFGCCGAMKENQCLLVLFSACLFLTFVLMIAGAVMAYGYQATLEDLLDKGLAEMKKDYDQPKIKEALDNIHQEFKCCEFSGNDTIPQSCYPPSASTAAPTGPTAAPPTAPTAAPTAPTAAPTAPTAAPTAAPTRPTAAPTSNPVTGAGRKRRAAGDGPYTASCSAAIMELVNKLLDEYKIRIAGIGVASAIIVVIGMIVSMALCCKIRRGYQNV